MSAGSTNKKNKGKYSSNRNTIDKKVRKLMKPGKTYTPAQMLALKRRALGKSIAEVKADNEKKMRDRARERNAKFKKNQKLKIKGKKNTKNNNLSGNEKVEKQKTKNKGIYKKKNFLSNIK